MIRRKTTLRAKSGGGTAQNGNGNGNPRTLVELVTYREHAAHVYHAAHPTEVKLGVYDSEYSGWSNAARPRDQAISLRSINFIFS